MGFSNFHILENNFYYLFGLILIDCVANFDF